MEKQNENLVHFGVNLIDTIRVCQNYVQAFFSRSDCLPPIQKGGKLKFKQIKNKCQRFSDVIRLFFLWKLKHEAL
jgi:hypothetical protein